MKKKVLITGAAKRIGRFLAEKFAEDGWDLILHYNASHQKITELKNELEQNINGISIELLQYDLSSSLSIEFQKKVKALSPIDLLINNASTYHPGNLLESSISDTMRQFQVNCMAGLELSKVLYEVHFKGNIINFLDTQITETIKNYNNYLLSKLAFKEVTLMLANEFAPDVRVNAIAPGAMLPPEDIDIPGEEYMKNKVSKTPLRIAPSLDSIYNSIQFILNNPHVTGQIFYCNSGEHIN